MARGLAEAGASVTLVERGECCKEASWAGGGIVSPLYPWRYSAPVTALASAAQSVYPQLAKDLFEETGIDPELEQTGLLMLDANDSAEALRWASQTGSVMVEETFAQFQYREPHLSSDFQHGLWMPHIANVRNPRLGKALRKSVQLNPLVTVLENTAVCGFGRENGRLVSASVERDGRTESLSAGQFIVTAGAWSGDLLSNLGVTLPVEPVKGQMLLFRPEVRLVNSVILSGGRYLIPRRDGHILVGSTLEYAQFDKTTTQQALESLLESASNLVPALKSVPVVQQWAGLRPGAPQGVPFIGRVDGFENLSINAGQYRNGLVLAPASAALLCDIILGRKQRVDSAPYATTRVL